jgi:uncharacterized RDD family membrane protein YckC
MEAKSSGSVASSGGMRYAGFWIRFLAYIIDGIILGVVGRILFGASVTQFDTYGSADAGLSFSVNYSGWRVLVPLAYLLIFWITCSATPGKMICGLKIVEESGQKLSWQKALLRVVGYMISAVVVFIGFIWIGFDKKKQGWHDKIAGTYVVKK